MTPYHGPDVLRVVEIELGVADLGRSATFYQDELGFVAVPAEQGVIGISANGKIPLLKLRELPGARPHGQTAGLYHIAFLLPSREELGRFLRRVIQRQIPIKGAADHVVSEAMYLEDPDGNGIEIYADTDDATWRNALGEITMATKPFDYSGVYYAARSAASAMPADTVIGHVHLAVGDLEASARFYRDGVGFSTTSEAFPAAFFFASGGYHHHLAINVWEPAGKKKPARAGLIAQTIVYPDCETATAAIDRIREAGYPLAETAAGPIAVDPDGNRIHITVNVTSDHNKAAVSI